jgi:hypothetical protein
MAKPTIEQIFHDATEPGPRWTNRQVAPMFTIGK